MRKYLFILLIVFTAFSGMTQNLVPNPSFENFTTCPTASGQITFASPWYNATTSGTTDFFNACSASGYGVPKHGGIGYQYSKSGNGYSGIWVYSSGPNYREYLQVPLIDTLQIGTCYIVEYYVNLFNTMKYALGSVDAHFSTIAIGTTGTGDVLNLSPQITKFSSTAISDTVLWTKISGIYMATGVENYLTIGNFFDDINTDTINTGSSYYGSYYYIDDVSVIPIDSILGGIPANAGNDTTIIGGDSVFVGQEITNLYCNWYIGATLIADSISGIFVSPITTTTYTVEQNLCGTISYDTVTVFVSGVGINENAWSNSINLYPNPSDGEFNIEYKGLGEDAVLVEIADVSGRIVYTQNLQLTNGISNFKLDISNGVYFVHITNTQNNETIVKKLVIQK